MWKLIEVMAADQFDSKSSRQTYLNQSPKFSGLKSLNGNKNMNQKFTEIYLGFDGNMRLHVNRDYWKYCVVGEKRYFGRMLLVEKGMNHHSEILHSLIL